MVVSSDHPHTLRMSREVVNVGKPEFGISLPTCRHSQVTCMHAPCTCMLLGNDQTHHAKIELVAVHCFDWFVCTGPGLCRGFNRVARGRTRCASHTQEAQADTRKRADATGACPYLMRRIVGALTSLNDVWLP